ncbi:MAG: polysaccharide biosynthesis/export family protein [Terracidiphilus sp.]|jgi:polysaccharide export outer membrane protein
MKPGSLLLAAFLAPVFFCHAQGEATQEAAKPIAQDAVKPNAQDTVKADVPDAARPTAQDAASRAINDSYVIGPTDVISLFIWKEPDLSDKELMVWPDGMIEVPLLGNIQASGKTPRQLADEIAAKLKKYIQDPNVTVNISGMHSKKVYLVGEIGKTGPVDMTPGMTLLQAIATAGGLTPYANSKKIYILRSEDGKQRKLPVLYKRALRGDAALNFILTPGDTIVVP